MFKVSLPFIKSSGRVAFTANHEIGFPCHSVLSNPNLVFHGIGSNISTIPSILKWGILSVSAAKRLEVELIGNFGRLGTSENGRDNVSVSKSPNHSFSRGSEATSFIAFSQKAISFVVDISTDSFKKGVFADEVFVPYAIEPRQIFGIMIPEEFLDLPLEKVSFQASTSGTSQKRGQRMYSFASDLTKVKNPELKKALNVDPFSFEETEVCQIKIEKFVSSAFLHIGIQTFRQLLPLVVPRRVCLFTNKGSLLNTSPSTPGK